MLTAEQMAMRKNGLGASEIPAIVGLNPWKNPLDVFLEKTGRAESPATAKTRRGSLLEPHILEWWAEQRGVTELQQLGTVVHSTHDWLFATPDAFARLDGQPILCETKSVGWRVRHHWPEGEIPDYVRIQVLIQQEVTGIHRADVAAWVDDDERIMPVDFSQEVANSLIEIAGEFWHDNVRKDVPPAVDASESWSKYLATKFPRDLAPISEAPEEADSWFRVLMQARADEADGKRRKEEAENVLKSIIGESAGIQRAGSWLVTWKTDSVGRVSWEKVASELGAPRDLIDRHTGKPGRRFLPKELTK